MRRGRAARALPRRVAGPVLSVVAHVDGGAIRFKHDFGTSGSELSSEAVQYFYCRDIFERVALGRRPMSDNASKVLQ